jgi:protein-tyrosine phosphatase
VSLPAPTGSSYRIGFVCLGNICRSPMADVILTDLVARAGLADKVEIASSGTGTWHLGEPMDPRAAAHLVAEGYDPADHRAQKFDARWLEMDLVLAMDAKNLAEINDGRVVGDRVRMFRSFDPLVGPDAEPEELDVPDPWFGGDEGFADVIAVVERTCRSLLAELEALGL